LDRLFAAPPAAVGAYAELFWNVAGNSQASLKLVLKTAKNLDEQGAKRLANLTRKAPRGLAVRNPQFAKKLLESFAGAQRQDVVNAFAYRTAQRGAAFFAGNADEHMLKEKKSSKKIWHFCRANQAWKISYQQFVRSNRTASSPSTRRISLAARLPGS
jgi:hypothetical protein